MIAGDNREKVQVSSLTSSSSASAPTFTSISYSIILIIVVYTQMMCDSAQIIVSLLRSALSVEDAISGSTIRVAFEPQDFMARQATLVLRSRVNMTRIDNDIIATADATHVHRKQKN